MRSNTDSISCRRRFTSEMESALPSALPLAILDGTVGEEALCISNVFSAGESRRREGRMGL